MSADKSFNVPIERADVMRLLPHREPMLFIDRVLRYDERSIQAQVLADPEWELFKGHFPDRPILPGVILIEMVAQAGALIGSLDGKLEDGAFIAFSGVERARFRRPVSPGDLIDIEAEITASRRGFYKFSGRARVDEQDAATVDFSATQMRFDT